MLRRLIRYSCIYEARMSPALNGSSAIRRFKHSDAIKIARGKEDALVTKNLVPGESVYGEKQISVEVSRKKKKIPHLG